jgi:hypothetical protein
VTRRAWVLLAVLAVEGAYLLWAYFRVQPLPSPDVPSIGSLLVHPTPGPSYGSLTRGQPFLTRSGHLRYGFEFSLFRPCGTSIDYWVWFTPEVELRELLRPYPSPPNQQQTLFIRGTFYVFPPGHYGHLAQYNRQVVFKSVRELRPPRPTDCGMPTR